MITVSNVPFEFLLNSLFISASMFTIFADFTAAALLYVGLV